MAKRQTKESQLYIAPIREKVNERPKGRSVFEWKALCLTRVSTLQCVHLIITIYGNSQLYFYGVRDGGEGIRGQRHWK